MTGEAKNSGRLRLLLIAVSVGAFAGFLAAAIYGVRLTAQPAVSPSSAARVGDFSLLDHDGKHHQLYRYAHSRAVVLFVHGSDCNIARDSLPALKQLRDQFANRRDASLVKWHDWSARLKLTPVTDGLLTKLQEYFGNRSVSFLMINANPQDDRKALQKDVRLYGIDIPILKDETQLVAESLQIKRSGEALLIDTRTWQVVYRGPVDDRLHFETQKAEAKQHYLRDAAEALIEGRPVRPAAPLYDIGCSISIDKKQDVSYARQVAPILIEKCVPCHQAGGMGPWAMESYEKVKGWSAMMREVLNTRRMPPWHADPASGDFSNDRSLSAEQKRTLVHWIDAGAPRGEGPDPLLGRKAQSIAEWPLGKPDVVIDVPEQQIPANGMLDYRYVEVPLPFDRDVWVRAVHLIPSNRAVMHHAFAFITFPKESGFPQPDWYRGLNAFFAVYAPGIDVTPFPDGSGQLLPKGSVIEFQLHYAAVGYATTDRPKLAIYLHQRPPPRALVVASAWSNKFRIPPHAKDHPVEASFVFDREALLYGFFPHMHVRGSRASFTARYPDGRSETLLSVPKYHFIWQTVYELRAPKLIPARTEILVRGSFDNSRFNPANPDPGKEVRFGKQSQDEMFIGYMLYTVPNPPVESR